MPSRKLLKIHGPLKCLAENKLSTNVFSLMYLSVCIFVFGSIAWDTKSKYLDIVLICVSFFNFNGPFEFLWTFRMR